MSNFNNSSHSQSNVEFENQCWSDVDWNWTNDKVDWWQWNVWNQLCAERLKAEFVRHCPEQSEVEAKLARNVEPKRLQFWQRPRLFGDNHVKLDFGVQVRVALGASQLQAKEVGKDSDVLRLGLLRHTVVVKVEQITFKIFVQLQRIVNATLFVRSSFTKSFHWSRS